MKSTQDTRTTRSTGAAVRGSRAAASESREVDAPLSAGDLRNLIRSEFTQEALPNLKAPDGWHFCWLSTTSRTDPIHKRMRVGYQPVMFEDVATQVTGNLDSYKVSGGEFSGCVSCNEMILFKIPNDRYQAIMAEFHHYMPLEEEQAIQATLKAPKDAASADRSGKPLIDFDEEDEGMRSLGKDVPLRSFN